MGAVSSKLEPAGAGECAGGSGAGSARSATPERGLAIPAPEAVATARSTARWLAATFAALVVWALAYSQLEPFSIWFVGNLPVRPGTHLHEALSFFALDTPKVLLLLTVVVFGMGVIRSFFSAERTRAMLAGRHEGVGNVAAAALGIVTPFCSCSAVPMFMSAPSGRCALVDLAGGDRRQTVRAGGVHKRDAVESPA
jgi:hypothetical protein